jgi:hypothetical protein
MRSMVEGDRRFGETRRRCADGLRPSTACGGPPPRAGEEWNVYSAASRSSSTPICLRSASVASQSTARS